MPLRSGRLQSRIAPILYALTTVATVWIVSRGTIAAASLLERVDHEADVLFIALRLFQMILFGLFLIAEDTRDRADKKIEHRRNKRFLIGFSIAYGSVLVLTLQGMRGITAWRWASVALGFAAAIAFAWLLARAAGEWLPNDARKSRRLSVVYAMALAFEVGFSGWAAHHMDTSFLLRMVTDPTVLIRGIGTVFLPARWTALSWIGDHPWSLPLWCNILCLSAAAGTAVRCRRKHSAATVTPEEPTHRLAFRQIAFPWLLPAVLGGVLFWIPVVLRLARFVFPYSSQIAQWTILLAGIVGLWLGWWIQGCTASNRAIEDRENSNAERIRVHRITFLSTGLFSVLIGVVTNVSWIGIATALVSMGIVAWPTRDLPERSIFIRGPGLLFTGVATWMTLRFIGRVPATSRALTASLVLGWVALIGLRYSRYYNLKKQRKNAS